MHELPFRMEEAGRTALSRSGGTGIEDVGALYRAAAKRLERMVRRNVHASDAVIEDACQFAWSRLLHHRDRLRRDTAFAWLLTTAVHEAFKLLRRERRELSLEAALDESGDAAVGSELPREQCSCSPAELLEQRERLAELRRLPARQQRLLWLHGLGLSYAEMARYEGYTERTVERQLLRAKHALRPSAA